MFDIRLYDEQREFQKLAREFAEKEIKPMALDLDSGRIGKTVSRGTS